MLTLIFVSGCFLVAQPTWISSESHSVAVDPDRMRADVAMLSQAFHPRDWQTPENLERSADAIADALRKAGAAVEFQTYEAFGKSYRNVIGRVGMGHDRKIIVGAHYDSCNDTPGADDNASGVAGMLELARIIGANPPDAEIEFVAYTLEEPPFFGGPLMGSAIHAASVADHADRIIGVIVLEMIGYFSDERGSQSYPLPLMRCFYPSRGNFITVVSRWDQGAWIKALKTGMKGATSLPIYSFRGPQSLPGVDFSDHRNYWAYDIPAAMVTNTAFHRNTAYHTVHDTAERLDYQRMAMVVTGVHHALLQQVKQGS